MAASAWPFNMLCRRTPTLCQRAHRFPARRGLRRAGENILRSGGVRGRLAAAHVCVDEELEGDSAVAGYAGQKRLAERLCRRGNGNGVGIGNKHGVKCDLADIGKTEKTKKLHGKNIW